MMSRVLHSIVVVSFVLLSAVERASGMKETAPATAPAESKRFTLAEGLIRYTPPDGWIEAKNVSRDDRAGFVPESRRGVLLIEVWPADGSLSAKAARAICRRIDQTRRKEEAEVLMPATIERDKRFDLRIHERYRQKEQTSDQLRLYRSVGGRIVVVTVNTASPDPDEVKDIHGAAEKMLLSAKSTKAPSRSKSKKRK